MESYSDSDSDDNGREIERHGHGDEDTVTVIDTEHASEEVDAEGDGEAEAVAGVDEGLNSCLGRILPRREGEESGDEEESNNNELRMPKRKLKDPAPVWKHCATRLPDGKGKCRFCDKIFVCTDGSTSTLVAHVKSKHMKMDAVKELISDIKKKKDEIELAKVIKKRKIEASKQPSILTFTGRRGAIDPVKKRKLDDALVQMTVGMDRPFEDVENYYFRQLLFIAEPNYICPSRKRHTTNFDQTAIKVKEVLKKDIIKDIMEAGHKTVTITSDHGTSCDIYRTKKNALTLARTTKDFVIKKDTITLIQCEGSQTGAKIREDVKNALILGAGWEEDWTVNWVTDNESKQVNARDPTKHAQIGMKTNYTGGCVDHTIELAVEESIDQCTEMKRSMKKLRSLVNYFKDAATAREAFKKIMMDARVDPLSIIQGTSNRWFFKYSEAKRALLLKEHISTFYSEFQIPDTLDSIEQYDWHMIEVYENALAFLVEAAKMFEGERYPTASSVIPFLDTVFDDLETLKHKVEGGAKFFVSTLLTNLKSQRRFPDGYKNLIPYNCLTLLDVRYEDLYFSKDEMEKTVHDLTQAKIYDDLMQGGGEGDVPVIPAGDVNEQAGGHQQQDNVSRRRAQLIAAKNIEIRTLPRAGAAGRIPLKERLDRELERFLKWRGMVSVDEDPNGWWRKHHEDYPLLAKFWMAHSSFPATSTSAERVFNMDGLILVAKR